ncbi:MAG: coproporphyrinogen III oxidase [Bacteroidetes bacterium 4572_77]|nr:MAG: coproporphyrinogen III oxidase [Bacteroidetes bacterium 4572_77]
MAGIYLHIPFCKRKCHYCNFFSLATQKYREEFEVALKMELKTRSIELAGQKIDSVYFGGGTPSLLSVKSLQSILILIQENYLLGHKAEITLEANPDDLSLAYLKELKSSMVNRLSVGIQSFDDSELQYVNRVHTAKEAQESVKNAQNLGFDNMSVDLIYGIPNSSMASWEKNLKTVADLKVSHLSSYSLTQESKTAYDVLVKKGRMQAPSEKMAIKQYQFLQNYLPSMQLEQYEISNYAAQEKYALHNTNYWRGISYLGVGPSAHSYNGSFRRWNKAHLKDYISSSLEGNTVFDEEKLSLVDKWNEGIMTALRTKWGVSISELESFQNPLWLKDFYAQVAVFEKKELLFQQDQHIVLSEKGKLFADGIAAAFFV